MATTGELRAIIELLELVDIGDAASYLGEETIVDCEYGSETLQGEQDMLIAHSDGCNCVSCLILHS